jgi:hypothetical protein
VKLRGIFENLYSTTQTVNLAKLRKYVIYLFEKYAARTKNILNEMHIDVDG